MEEKRELIAKKHLSLEWYVRWEKVDGMWHEVELSHFGKKHTFYVGEDSDYAFSAYTTAVSVTGFILEEFGVELLGEI